MFDRRRALALLASLPVFSTLDLKSIGAVAAAEPTRGRVLLVLNDIWPAVLPTGMPYRILSCKDLVKIRNAFVGLTSERILSTQEFTDLYLRVKRHQEQRLQEYHAALNAIESGWKTDELERVKTERVGYYLDSALTAIAATAGLVLSATAACYVVGTVTVVSAAKSTWQLFRIEKSDNVVEFVAAFNDAKFGTLGMFAQRMDPNAAAALKNFNKYTWYGISQVFTAYGLIRTETGVRRLTLQKELIEAAKRNVDMAMIEINGFLSSKERFLEFVRVMSGNAALATEKLWTATSLNNCALDGTIGISRLMEPSPSGPILRSLQ